MIDIHIDDHLLIPFGAKKYEIDTIRLVGVSTGGTYFKSPIPVAHIDLKAQRPLRLSDMNGCFPDEFEWLDGGLAVEVAAAKRFVMARCDERSASEKKFIELYFQFVAESTEKKYDFQKEPPRNDPTWFWAALLPLPQAHLYVQDPFSDSFVFKLERMFKVDFAFWTGKQIVAVEIDGGSHYVEGRPGGEAREDHIIRDRMLQRANVRTIHVLNEELLTHGTKVISRLLPPTITQFWKGAPDSSTLSPFNPF